MKSVIILACLFGLVSSNSVHKDPLALHASNPGSVHSWPWSGDFGSALSHGVDWVSTVTHTIRRVVFFDPEHAGHEAKVMDVLNTNFPVPLPRPTSSAPTPTADFANDFSDSSTTEEPATTLIDEDYLRGFEPVAAFVKDDTLLVEPAIHIAEDGGRGPTDVMVDFPEMPSVKTSHPPRHGGVFHIALGAIGLSAVVTGVVLMTNFKGLSRHPTILVTRGVQTV